MPVTDPMTTFIVPLGSDIRNTTQTDSLLDGNVQPMDPSGPSEPGMSYSAYPNSMIDYPVGGSIGPGEAYYLNAHIHLKRVKTTGTWILVLTRLMKTTTHKPIITAGVYSPATHFKEVRHA